MLISGVMVRNSVINIFWLMVFDGNPSKKLIISKLAKSLRGSIFLIFDVVLETQCNFKV